MADIRAVDINIRVKDIDNAKTPRVPGKKTTPKPPEQGNSQNEDRSNLSSMSTILLHEAYRYAKQDIMKVAQYELSKYFNLRDDYIGQRNMNVAKNVISKTVGMGTAVAGGFMVGGPIGATIAAVGTMATLGIEIAQNYDQENIRLRQMNAQLSYSRQRAGYSLTSDSIGEDL